MQYVSCIGNEVIASKCLVISSLCIAHRSRSNDHDVLTIVHKADNARKLCFSKTIVSSSFNQKNR